MIAGFKIVGMILDVTFCLAAIFKKHLAANDMERAPLLVATRRSEFMFGLDHLSNRRVPPLSSHHTLLYALINLINLQSLLH